MPQNVNTQDATNFLKDGYVSRTQATRDGAGNIKLYEDTTNATNTTIMVEPVTSQFTVETALKLFETRFEYFKFPVQTVAAGSLEKINESIDQEVANTLAGVSFEQDLISRRLELVPLVEGSDKIRWVVPTPYYAVNFNKAEEEEKATRNAVLGAEFEDTNQPTRKFLSSYQKIINNQLRFKRGTTDPNNYQNIWYGFQSVDLINSNSPRGKGWFRISSDMLSQIRAGGQISTPSNDNRPAWKRNIKLKFSCTWEVDDEVKQAFRGHSFIQSEYVKDANDYGVNVNLHNGVCLFVRLDTAKWTSSWNRDLEYNEPEQPIFIQTTSEKYGGNLDNRSDSTNYEDRGRYNAMQYESQDMEIEYVIDSRDLFWDLNLDSNITEYSGLHQEYCWNIMATHPVTLTRCDFEISVEELPDDIATNSSYEYYTNQPKTDYTQWRDGGQKQSNQFRSLFCKYTYSSTGWIGGVRRVNGRNILGIQQGLDRLVVGYTDNTGKWNSMHTWSGYKWKRSTYYYLVNDTLFDAWYGFNNYMYYDKTNFLTRFNRKLGQDAVAYFKNLDTVIYTIKNDTKVAIGSNTNIDGATNNPVTNTTPARVGELIKSMNPPTPFIYNNIKYAGLDNGPVAEVFIKYKNGNGQSYPATTINTNEPGVTFEIPAGKLENGNTSNKSFSMFLKGQPSGKGSLKFLLEIFGQKLEMSIAVFLG